MNSFYIVYTFILFFYYKSVHVVFMHYIIYLFDEGRFITVFRKARIMTQLLTLQSAKT